MNKNYINFILYAIIIFIISIQYIQIDMLYGRQRVSESKNKKLTKCVIENQKKYKEISKCLEINAKLITELGRLYAEKEIENGKISTE